MILGHVLELEQKLYIKSFEQIFFLKSKSYSTKKSTSVFTLMSSLHKARPWSTYLLFIDVCGFDKVRDWERMAHQMCNQQIEYFKTIGGNIKVGSWGIHL